MKILQLIQKKQLRGAEVFASQISEYMKQSNHEVIIVALIDGDAKLPYSGDIKVLNANIKLKWLDWSGWRSLSEIINKFNPDIVQANAGDTLKYAVLSKKIFRWKQPVIFRNASMMSHYSNLFFTKAVTNWLLKNVQHILSVSNFTKKDIIKHFKIKEKNISTIPIGIELEPYQKLQEKNNETINLVHVGGFSFEKNHERLLMIFKSLFQIDNRYRLSLIGDGSLKQQIRKLAVDLGINDYIFFAGIVYNPLDYIYSSDVLLLPSKIEGLPAVIIEAFYCNTPVVAYNVGGISELVIHEETGWLVNSDDEAAFINAVEKIKHLSKDRLNSILNAAYKKAVTNFNNEKIAGQFIDIYQLQKVKSQ